jgi:hypothetical protein
MASPPPATSRTNSQTGTLRERFLKSLGIPSFQHPIEPRVPYQSITSALNRGGVLKREDHVTSSSAAPVDKDDSGDPEDVDKASLPGPSTTSLAPAEADKRASSIRLRNYKSIGNLDVKNREQPSSGDPEKEKRFLGGAMSAAKSLPLDLTHSLVNEELEGEANDLMRRNVVKGNPLRLDSVSFLGQPYQDCSAPDQFVVLGQVGRVGRN